MRLRLRLHTDFGIRGASHAKTVDEDVDQPQHARVRRFPIPIDDLLMPASN
jgi:hypothetical protein